MKRYFAILMSSACMALAAHAQGIAEWAADVSRWQSADWDCGRGETLRLQASFKSGRDYLDLSGVRDAALCWQTNGMGGLYWSAPASVDTNSRPHRIVADFTPEMDCGAAAYGFFLRAAAATNGPVQYRAHGAIRMHGAPGANLAELAWPVRRLDFAGIEVLNAPWSEDAVLGIVTGTVTKAYVEGLETDPTVPAWAKSATPPVTVETDPTVPAWAKADAKPAYDYAEIGGAPDSLPNPKTLRAFPTDVGWTYTGGATRYIDGGSNVTLRAEGSHLYIDAAGVRSLNGAGGDLFLGISFPGHEVSVGGGPTNGLYVGTVTVRDKSGWWNVSEQDQSGGIMPWGETRTDLYADPSGLTNAFGSAAYRDAAEFASAADEALVYQLLMGSNVVAEVTNYNSRVHAPQLRILQLDPDTREYIPVWTETNGLTRTLNDANAFTAATSNALDMAKADRAWSRTTSGMGVDAPEGVTWISTPETVIAGGYEYERHVTTHGEVWVLTSNGMGFGGDTNSYFRVSTPDGETLFSIEKTDEQVVGVLTDGIRVSGGTVTLNVGAVTYNGQAPICMASQSVSGPWSDLSEGRPDWISSVATNGVNGAWSFELEPTSSTAFFYFLVRQPGATVIKNSAQTDLSGGILVEGTRFYPHKSGSTLTWTTTP